MKKDTEVEWFVKDDKKETCAACGCEGPLTLHHLVPQVKCTNKYKKVKDNPNNHVMLCRSCHDQVHALWTENELRDSYFTFDRLMSAPEFKKFVEWKKKHPNFKGHSKMSKEHKVRV